MKRRNSSNKLFDAAYEVRLTPEEFIEKFGTPTVERTQPPRREDVQ